MLRKESFLIGIELHEQEIRVVQLRHRSNQASIQKVGRIAMPRDAIAYGRVHQPALIAQSLRRLLDSMGIQSGNAVLGLSGEATIIRSFAVPTAPDEDLAKIV